MSWVFTKSSSSYLGNTGFLEFYHKISSNLYKSVEWWVEEDLYVTDLESNRLKAHSIRDLGMYIESVYNKDRALAFKRAKRIILLGKASSPIFKETIEDVDLSEEFS